MSVQMSSSSDTRGSDLRGMARRSAPLIGAALAMVALAVVGYLVLTSYFMRSEAQLTPQRAQFFADSMDQALTRLEHLPYVLSIDPMTLDALETKQTGTLNTVLADVAIRARAEFIYVLDGDGLTIAASNFADEGSLVGNHYTFRPYFRDAITGGEGRFFAVGVTSGRPGYYISEPVYNSDRIIVGVVVVKLGFADVSRVLVDSGALVLATNQQGIVLASSNPDLTYGFLAPLSQVDRETLSEQQQFGDKSLFPLDWVQEGASRARLDGTAYIWSKASLTQEDWTLHLLSEVGDIRRQALLYVAVGIVTCLALIVAAASYRAAQLRQALSISDADRLRLASEIEERKRAEEKLERARSDLARKNQLAALGQLSASITHELGQPISAMRNYLTAEEIATGAAPGGLWPELSGLVDHMQGILNQLRLFGRKAADAPLAPFSVQQTVEAARQLVQHTADASEVALKIDMPPGDLTLNGQPQRFEQVIVNLLRNAIDAAGALAGGEVVLRLEQSPDMITILVTDTGPGLGDLDIADLREPFFSTKPSGVGMGLGLAISAQIVSEMGGMLDAWNAPDQGAVFSIAFPREGVTDV